ncbi:hypothetical protein E1B28_000889 [Marasmius oreades]|uniref:Chromatin remodeling factor mit1 n=1 Tax=Marasmius oreades TaxID=181124 RepID=A0A9P7V2D2_9AGAR|nr:uncharacterized protein E1B28_000889 [Marasmius oreades]KAG7099004.1 hypothetical protein E1B28_000889 [Marasmius oreades]
MPDSHLPERPSKSLSTVYVIPPRLSPTQKSHYKDLSWASEDYPVDEIVSEFTDQKDRKWYYARYQGGIIRAFVASEFVKKYQDLVGVYEEKKNNRLLPAFDPTTSKEVHPDHRLSIIMNLDMKRKRVTRLSISSTSSSRYHDDSEPSPESESEAVSGVEFNADVPSSAYDSPTPSRTTRYKLLSPRKTRSRKVIPVDDDDGAGASNGLRRSTRSNKGLRIPLDDDVYVDDSQDEDDVSFAGSKTFQRKAKSAKSKNKDVKIVPPAYGHFRPIEETAGNDEEPLLAHRQFCEKCFEAPAHKLLALLKKKGAKGKRRTRNTDPEDDSSSDEEDKVLSKGGWVRCLKCPVSAHWGCLAKTQQDEILKATRKRDQDGWMVSQGVGDAEENGPPRRKTLEVGYSTEFICGSCTRGGICMGCMNVALDANPSVEPKLYVVNEGGNNEGNAAGTVQQTREGLLFRCLTCKRLAHYEHLQKDGDPDQVLADIAQSHQHNWLCTDCASYQWKLDNILAWRPYPPNAVEPPRAEGEPANYKMQLPREYLVKWVERGYRRTQWVPHMWLLSTYPQKLRYFLQEGPKVRLLLEPRERKNFPESELPAFNSMPGSRDSSAKPGAQTPVAPRNALPDAEQRIPLSWMTIDRVLEVQLKRPTQSKKLKKNGRIRKVVESEEEEAKEDAEDAEESQAYQNAYDLSEEPEGFTESIDEFEGRTGRPFEENDIDRVIWGLFKWNELGYDHATPDSPPRLGDETYDAFREAMRRYIASRNVEILKPKIFDEGPYGDRRQKDGFRRQHTLKNPEDLDLGQAANLKLMPFQVDGFNWLCDNWWNRQPCILADEMGLGKTVQITSFLGKIITSFHAAPALVVVPNSTITNWVREFERWAPQLRVVPFYGEARSREVVKTFELYHEDARARKLGMKTKFHVLVTTYEAITNKADFTSVFKNQPRWEVLVIDEGQRLKNDTSLLFKKLNELNTSQRVIMTGTPLNNNIRELFNLMNFLDPERWKDLQALEKEHEELTEALVKQLHVRLRPYFLRRIKSEVLQLPPKNEVIVPVSMAPLQKQIYRSILSHNADLLSGLTNPFTASGNAPGRKSVNNMLMQLRKCLQHPYLYDRDIEPMNLSLQETHEKLIDASAKFRLLHSLLPKLQSRGHRVLLFSQFVIALDVIEDFLVGEGIKYLRLDGNTAGHERQRGMDAFNAVGSDIFIYLLTTRAGGVGINLFTADTVIIFDPDFNPHQDLQAIARAHRYGQQKTVLVFKLMVKQSAEERIMQVGKKKMVLDHLIVQKMEDDDDAGADVQSILMYGAQALFEEGESSKKDIVYTDNDIDKLIEKTEREGDAEEVPREGGTSFTFAKIWTSDKDQLAEVRDENQEDSWAHTLQKINAEMDLARAKEAAQMGRGARRKATAPVPKAPDEYLEHTPKGKQKRRDTHTHSSDGDSIYNASDTGKGSDSSESDGYQDRSSKSSLPAASGVNGSTLDQICGLCGQSHATDGYCAMTDSSQNLAEFREMLILHADDEPYEQRVAAIRAIEETLFKRGDLHLIRNQPLHPIPPEFVSLASSAQFTRPLEPHGASTLPMPNAGSSNTVKHRKPSGKRPSSPIPDHPAKKPKPQPTLCPVCETATHLLKDCPIVLRGPPVVLKAIMRLESAPGMSDVTNELRKILKKQKKAQSDLEGTRDPHAGLSRNTIILD